MKQHIVDTLKEGGFSLLGLSFSWQIGRTGQGRPVYAFDASAHDRPYKLHIGPGPNWVKPDNHWINVDVEPRWSDIALNFNGFESFPLDDATVECIYASHVFEHVSIWLIDKVFAECHRVLVPGGVLRIIIPDVEKSMREYLDRNDEFPLFVRRRERAKSNYGLHYTLFDCLREDFVSRSAQPSLLGQRALAHQNAWDYESLYADLTRAGFSEVTQHRLGQSQAQYFGFEGTYRCEALEENRSLYVEARR